MTTERLRHKFPDMPDAWRCWYHCTSHTYGSWLRGDPRGWRSRHHREHVEGDYKHPPAPGTYDRLFERSKRLMKRDPVRLERKLRYFIARMVAERLQRDETEVLVVSMDSTHLHLVARFRDSRPKDHVGHAKLHATFRLKELGLAPEGGVWAKGSKAIPVTGRHHQVNAIAYVLDHELEGAAVWVSPRIKKFVEHHRATRYLKPKFRED